VRRRLSSGSAPVGERDGGDGVEDAAPPRLRLHRVGREHALVLQDEIRSAPNAWDRSEVDAHERRFFRDRGNDPGEDEPPSRHDLDVFAGVSDFLAGSPDDQEKRLAYPRAQVDPDGFVSKRLGPDPLLDLRGIDPGVEDSFRRRVEASSNKHRGATLHRGSARPGSGARRASRSHERGTVERGNGRVSRPRVFVRFLIFLALLSAALGDACLADPGAAAEGDASED
jgi:hypothetical protein